MRNYFWGMILVIVGVLILLDHLDVVQFEDVVHDYWPLILIIWGFSMLVRKKRHTPDIPTDQYQHVGYDLLHQSSVFGNVHTSITSPNFKGGSVSTVFGDCIVDLSKASFDTGEHLLRLHSVFGNTSIILPKDAAVSVSASSVFGSLTMFGQHKSGISSDIQTATPNYDSAPNRLKISLSKVFGDARVD